MQTSTAVDLDLDTDGTNAENASRGVVVARALGEQVEESAAGEGVTVR